MNDGLVLRWCDDRGRIPELVAFFVAQTGPDYISHGEIMGGRADGPGRWSARLAEVLGEEFAECAFPPEPSSTGKRIVLAESGGALAGFALVELAGEGGTRHAVLHDIIVDRSGRGGGAGRAMLEWIEAALRAEGVRHVFLESGEGNEGAHRFFERAGYRKSSVTMMKALGVDQSR